MAAAAALDPVFFTKNALGMYRVQLAGMCEDKRAEIESVVKVLAEAGEDAASELTSLELFFLPLRYNATIDKLVKRTEVQVRGRTVQKVVTHKRIDFYANTQGEQCPTVTRAVIVLLSMHVTPCSAEPNWSTWGATFVQNRSALGLEKAQDLMFVQQNDPMTRMKREANTFV
jgi:hypothetical protein